LQPQLYLNNLLCN